MSRRLAASIASFACVAAIARAAVAQPAPSDAPKDDMLAPSRALEIGVQAGVTQPFGDITKTRRVADLVDAGFGASFEIGYRATPRWTFSAWGHFHESSADDSFVSNVALRGAAAGLSATYHAVAFQSADAFLSFGSGYRMLWIVPEGEENRVLHGVDIARVAAGIEFRVTPRVSFGPVVGADLDVLLWDDPGSISFSEPLSDPRALTFLFAGVDGRFDLGGRLVARDGSRRSGPAVAAR